MNQELVALRYSVVQKRRLSYKEGLNGEGPHVGCRLEFHYFVGCRLKFLTFVGCR